MFMVITAAYNIGPFKSVRAAKMYIKKTWPIIDETEYAVMIEEITDPEFAAWAEQKSVGTITIGSSESGQKSTEQNSQSSATTSTEKRSKT